MKTIFSNTFKISLLLSATLGLNAWGADTVQQTPDSSDAVVLTNLGEPDGVDSTAVLKDANEASSAATEAKKSGSPSTQEDGTTSFANVGMPGNISPEELSTNGSPAKYREVILNKSIAAPNENPSASRRYLAVDRATYQSRIGQ
ncbi:MAG: hypothetical protein WCG50_03865 [Rhodoferax sp.]|uniref:hypothetical protein n=1 Tax=Rhodoferax sp. TaxID=50421 RepID=UPI00301638C6